MRRTGPPELALAAGALVLLVASVVGAFRGDDPAAEVDGEGTSDREVAIIDFTYQPSTVRTAVGDPVRWTNQDSAVHTVTSDGDGPLDSGDLAEGEVYEATFDSAGTYAYLCTIHPFMKGTVEVGP